MFSGALFRPVSRGLTVVLILVIWTALMQFSYAGIAGATDENNATVEDTQIAEDVLYPEGAASDGYPAVPPVASQDVGNTVTPSSGRVPDFITRLQRAADHGGWNCNGVVCQASRDACTAAPDYTMYGGEILARPRASSAREGGALTFESITQDTRSGAETSNGYSCQVPSRPTPGGGGIETAVDAEAPEPVVIIMTQSDFAKLPVKPSVASAGPERGWLPAGMVNVLHAEHEVQTLQTELLGTPVAVRAIPTSYHWDLGDGNTITTSKPGKPYPSEEVSAKYSGEGWYDVTLTTTFAGQFSVDGGEWQDIDGTIEVASEPIALYSKSLESRLVNGDVPVDEEEDPWVPERSPETEGPQDPDARHREI